MWSAKSLQITQDKTVAMSPFRFFWWVPELKIMGECLWFDVISSVWLVVRHVKWQNRVHKINFLHQVLKILINTSNKKSVKGHSWLLQNTIKVINMMLHVCMVCVLQSHCKSPKTKQWQCHHSGFPPEFQIWKSWGAYGLMLLHLCVCVMGRHG